MEQAKLIFGNNQESGHESLSGASPVAMNVVIDSKGTVLRRPGIKASLLASSAAIDANGIDALHATYTGKTYAVSGLILRSIYDVGPSGFTNLSTLGSGSDMVGSQRPVFSETEAIVAIAAGAAPEKIVLATNTASRLGGGPPNATHMISHGSRLLANTPDVDKSKIQYSGLAAGNSYANHEVWALAGISGYFSGEARADPIVALHENTNLVFAFGRSTLQTFATDSVYVYAPAQTINLGCAAPYSVIRIDDSFAWLDDHRRFVVSDGSSYNVISEAINRNLMEMADISTCFGYRIYAPPVDCLVWTFPDGRTFARQTNSGWSQWMERDATANVWKRLRINCHCYHPSESANLVGTTDGHVYEMSTQAADDMGTPIMAVVETGFQNHDTEQKKHCVSITMSFKRGASQSATRTYACLRYADSPDEWTDPIRIDLGHSGDRYPVVQFRSLGVYRKRNWKLEFSSSEELALSGVTEQYEILEG